MQDAFDGRSAALTGSSRSAATSTGLLAQSGSGDEELLLVSRIGGLLVALPASAIERVVQMAALTPLPDAPPGIAGMLDLGGTALVAVDPRPRLGQPPTQIHPAQRLIVMVASTRYLLWVDAAEQIVSAGPHDFGEVATGQTSPLAQRVVHLQGAVVPVLSPDALDPGLAGQQAGRSDK